MSDPLGPEPGVWQRLRRRRVTRTAVTYLAVAFAVTEATWYAASRYGLQEDVARLVMGAFVLGFPLSVVLAWAYDITPAGVVRTPDEVVEEESDPPRWALRRPMWMLLCAFLVGLGLLLRAFRM